MGTPPAPAGAAAVATAGSGVLTLIGKWLSNWRRLTRDAKVVVAIALLAALVAAAIVVILWTSSRQFVPLYGKQELYDKANILSLLDQLEFAYRLDGTSGDILVREDELSSARMALAAQGVRAALPAGLEGLDKVSALGTSQFMESARYRHAIEGELARTIIALDGVRSARVHIAQPERTLFVGRAEQKATASVLIDVIAGRGLESDQVEAIVNLVAGSVPGLEREAVSVIDQTGRLLSAGLFDSQGVGRLSLQQLEYTQRVEQAIARRANDMLLPLLGADNYRVQVAADMDFSVVEETRKTLDDTPTLASESRVLESDIESLAMGIPGALSNRPPRAAPTTEDDDDGDQPEATRRREETSSRFEIGSAVTHTRQQQARLRTLSVSVLVNSGAAPASEWTEAELARLGAVLQRAVGYSADRGDQFSLEAFSFSPAASTALTPAPLAWWHDPVVQGYLRYAIGGLLVLALILFGVRPLVQHLIRTQSREPAVGVPVGAGEDGPQVVLSGGNIAALPAAVASETLTELPPPGSELEVQLKHLRLLADKETARVTEVIRQWAQNHG
ncbi:MAG: flagellar basal-body MS-ring/collar protein FliF [Spongiibacteraceae bacterium]|jgi:flagellar M-ring protein FliF|nr:flagellar basal-body MS-ring/collar protein FliF [Spongiibacteraceae bacterium]